MAWTDVFVCGTCVMYGAGPGMRRQPVSDSGLAYGLWMLRMQDCMVADMDA